MTGFFKKLMATGTALSLGLSAMAFADQVYNYGNNCCPQPACGPSSCGNGGGWCDNIKLDASFLYWKVAGDELDYAYDVNFHEGDEGERDFYRKRFHNVSGDYDPGFKLGLGLDLPCICWDTNLVWTHFDTKNSSHHDVDYRNGASIDVAIPFLQGSEVGLGQGEKVIASGSLNFKYDVVDLEFGKWICCNNCLLFRPHVGLRAANIREKFHSQLDHYATTGTSGDIVDYSAHIKNEFKGVGVRAGLDTDLQLCEGWSVIGRAAASVLWGQTKISNYFTEYDELVNRDVSQISYETDHYRHSRVITDLSLGIRYRTCVCSCPFAIEAAWEHHYLFSQHRFFASDTFDSEGGYNFKKNGDVSLQGLTVTASFEF